MEGDYNVYVHSSLWMRPTRPDRYNAKMVYSVGKKGDGFLLFLKAFSWETVLLLTLVDFTVKNAKFWREIFI